MVCLVKPEARQGWTPREKGCESPPEWEGVQKKGGWFVYTGQFFRVFVFLQANYMVPLSTPDLSWDTPLGVHTPLSQDGSQSEGFWEKRDSLWPGVIPWPLTHKEFFCTCVESPLSQKRGKQRYLNHLLKQASVPLCPHLDYCHDYYLKRQTLLSTREKHWLFTLFLLLLPFQRTNRRLNVNTLAGAHLSLVSRNANSCK